MNIRLRKADTSYRKGHYEKNLIKISFGFQVLTNYSSKHYLYSLYRYSENEVVCITITQGDAFLNGGSRRSHEDVIELFHLKISEHCKPRIKKIYIFPGKAKNMKCNTINVKIPDRNGRWNRSLQLWRKRNIIKHDR